MTRVLLFLALAACASAPGPRQIAGDFADRLADLKSWPLSVRCQAVSDAMDRCQRARLPRNCAWDGWNDTDHDAWTIQACRERLEEAREWAEESVEAVEPEEDGASPEIEP